MAEPDVVVVGSGPNGLAAAVTCARAGLHVLVIEGQAGIGGGGRTEELTLPGFRHDVCSAVHPAALASPFFRAFGLRERIEWAIPDVSYAHPLQGAPAAVAWRSLDRTAAGLGADGRAWRRQLGPLVRRVDDVTAFAFDSLVRWPDDAVLAARFGLRALARGTTGPVAAALSLAGGAGFASERARALFAGVAAHVAGSQPSLASAGAALVLAAQAHGAGWGLPVGGSQAIVDTLAADLTAHGGAIETGRPVRSLAELPKARAVLLDTGPRLLLTASERLPARYSRAVQRFRYGPGAAKVDFALAEPVPWLDRRLAAAPTLHIGGTEGEIRRAERTVAAGGVPRHPYILAVQPTVVDPTRAPAGKHVLWAYTHVPAGSGFDPAERITDEIERLAPGFRDTVLARRSWTARDLQARNPNEVGGDISGGAVTMWQMLARPVLARAPWRTPLPGVYLCSASTPPGPAVHGMSGWLAARLALRERFGITGQVPLRG